MRCTVSQVDRFTQLCEMQPRRTISQTYDAMKNSMMKFNLKQPRANGKAEKRTSCHCRGHGPVGGKSSLWDSLSCKVKTLPDCISSLGHTTHTLRHKNSWYVQSIKFYIYLNQPMQPCSPCYVLAQDLKHNSKATVRNLE